MTKFIQVSPEGDFYLEGNKLNDQEFCSSFIKSLRIEKNVCKGFHKGESIFVEAKSYPMLVQDIERQDNDSLKLTFNYDYKEEFNFLNEKSLYLDDWSRLCGRSKASVPFVFSKEAQVKFLSSIAEPIDAETFKIDDKTFELDDWYQVSQGTDKEDFWTGRYKESHTPWDLKTHHPAIDWVVPRLKLSKSRILVPGCGRGHDVHKLGSLGHNVTGLDFSFEAISEAKKNYPESNFACGDLFKFAPDTKFDAIFEHTLFCALNPANRAKIIRSWLRLLDDDACLIGVFNVSCKQEGPPFGMTEWELEELLTPHFIINFWGRLRDKESPRPGKELFVQAQKRKGK